MNVTLNDNTKLELSLFMDSFEVLKMCNDIVKHLHHINTVLDIKKPNFFQKVIFVKEGSLFFYKYLQLLSENLFGMNSLFLYENSITVKSYINEKNMSINLIEESFGNVYGQNILLIDDICDTGKTINFIKNFLYENGAKSVYTHCFFIRKKYLDFTSKIVNSFSIPLDFDNFIVGMGLDYNGFLRELGAIYKIESIIIE